MEPLKQIVKSVQRKNWLTKAWLVVRMDGAAGGGRSG
jgi:hypothetical protein